MSKAVKQLEEHLGIRLLHRTTRKLSLTDEGARLFELADPGLRLLDEALGHVQHSRHEMDGVIRVTAPLSIGSRILVPLVRGFQEQHPGTHFDFQLDDHFTDLVAAKIDVGFRAGTAPERNVVARQLRKLSMTICASPDYLRQHGTPDSLESLLQHRCTGFRHPNTGRLIPWELQIGGEIVFQEVPAVATFNDVEAEVAAVRAGIGIGQLTDYMIGDDLETGKLIPLLPQFASARLGLYIYYPQRERIPLRVRRFIDFVVETTREA
jgi:DNA-binding transcriptional LysR family regulator